VLNTNFIQLQFKDHLDNVGLSYSDGNLSQDEIIEESNYYPFGLKQKGYNVDVVGGNSLAQNWKFNGMELSQELGLETYDFGARNYDAALGRWMNIDPLAETSRRFSPYTYALDNPIYFIDPDGMEAIPAAGGGAGSSSGGSGSLGSAMMGFGDITEDKIANSAFGAGSVNTKSFSTPGATGGGNSQNSTSKNSYFEDKDLKIAKKLKQGAIDKINDYEGKISGFNKTLENKTLSIKNINIIKAKITDLKGGVSELNKFIVGINELIKSPQKFTYVSISGNKGFISLSDNNTVQIKYISGFGSGNKYHETVHAIQYVEGVMIFNNEGILDHVLRYRISNEVRAYMIHYMMNRGSLPGIGKNPAPVNIIGVDYWFRKYKPDSDIRKN